MVQLKLSKKSYQRTAKKKSKLTVRSVAGKDLVIISEQEKAVYRKIEKTIEKEQLSKRDD